MPTELEAMPTKIMAVAAKGVDPQRLALDRDRSSDAPAQGLTEHEKYLFDING